MKDMKTSSTILDNPLIHWPDSNNSNPLTENNICLALTTDFPKYPTAVFPFSYHVDESHE